MRVVTYIFVILWHFSALSAVLDGRITPVILTSKYTFTNFEWVKGRVTFLNGFDLPVNGTVLMDNAGVVYGTMIFDNSTLILKNHLLCASGSLLKGVGFISPENNKINLEGNMVLRSGDRFIFTSNGEIRGKKNNMLQLDPARLVFTPAVDSFTLSNIYIRDLYSIVTTNNTPGKLVFRNVKYVFYSPLTYNCPQVEIQGFVDLQAGGGSRKELIISQSLVLKPGSQLNVRTGGGLIVNKIISSDSISSIILDAARLVYTSTATSQYLFYNVAGTGYGRGRVIVRGQSELMVNTASSKLMVTPESAFIFESGARLKLSPSTKLVIY